MADYHFAPKGIRSLVLCMRAFWSFTTKMPKYKPIRLYAEGAVGIRAFSSLATELCRRSHCARPAIGGPRRRLLSRQGGGAAVGAAGRHQL